MKIIASTVIALFCLLFGMSGAMAARSAPLVEKSYVFDEKSPRTAEQIRDYILAGAGKYKELSYKIESDSPGALQLEFNKDNNHYASVLFTYDSAGFKTTYVTSNNLNYTETNGVRSIHPNYMVWLDEMFVQMKIAHGMRLNAKGEPSDLKALAVLNFATNSGAATVLFEKWDANSQCGDFERVGRVSKLSPEDEAERQKKVEEWNEKYKDSIFGKRVLQKYIPIDTELTRYVPGASPIQIRTSAFAAGASCGPLNHRFTPENGKNYSIELSVTFTGGKYIGFCNQEIFDDTDPELRVPVPKEDIPECKKKSWFKFGQTSN
jgi:hypothetical protein